MGYYSVIKKIIEFVTIRIDLVTVIQGYMSYTEKDKYHMTPCICGIQDTRQMNKHKAET